MNIAARPTSRRKTMLGLTFAGRSASPPSAQSSRRVESPAPPPIPRNAEPPSHRWLQRATSAEILVEARKAWGDLWPAILSDLPPRPLMSGVGQVLKGSAPDAIAWRLMTAYLRRRCGSLVYLRAVAAEGSMRYRLDGDPVDPVSDDDREHARQCVMGEARRYPGTAAPAPAGTASFAESECDTVHLRACTKTGGAA